MRKILLTLILLFPITLISQAVVTNPSPIEVDLPVTITIDANSTDTDCNGFSSPSKIYAHLGLGDDDDEYGIKVKGNWGQDDGVGEMSPNGDGTWSITFTPNTYFNLTPSEEANVTKMGMVFRNEDGTQEFKDNDCSNFIFNVGAFQIVMISPESKDNGFLVLDNPGSTAIVAQTANGSSANFQLYSNGSSLDIQNTNFYFYNWANITQNQDCELVITQDSSVIRKYFTILVDGSVTQDLPSVPANLENGINYHPSDATKATLVLDAPGKDFVYIAGSFNSYSPTAAYAMKKDGTSGKFWIELSGLTSGNVETYQYWVADLSPVTDSPKLVKTADPFSTLVLSPFDDPWISDTTFPNLDTTYAYPEGQEREVTVLQTGQTPYNWQVTNFSKPKKEDLIIYEVLIRDFDTDRNFQDLIDKIDYFKNLNINAIQLMPVMEFEGNESWGYNTSFHLALDKFYGTEEKFKELIDLCHQNGIAVILDVALNHAFGRNPINRMWMDDSDGDGWGEPSSENPYMNEEARHSYSVGSDFNHQSTYTQYYTERVIERWINDFKIDGFRWDLTKGFTQQCTSGDEGCTNGYRSDRVQILKDYADYSWSLDSDHYVIFEHLGGNTEESEWAEYRIGEGKGIMLWGKMTEPYNQLAMGYNSSNDISGMGHDSRGWTGKRLVGYAESHDEERLMYKNVAFGASGISGNLNAALGRMDALGAVSLTIPGPKMIWHFGELGMDNSIFTCSDGSYLNDGCKLSTKPQPQWDDNWLGNANRNQIYNAWARINDLKINEDVFEGSYSLDTNTLTPKIYIWDDTLPSSSLKNIVIISNFNTTSQNVNPNFPYGGLWYDLMDETGATTISGSTTSVNLAAGDFKIYGNASSLLSDNEVITDNTIKVFPNPTKDTFSINQIVNNVSLFDLTGKLVLEFNGEYNKGTTFNIANLAKSVYVVKFSNSSGIQHTTKIIKQ